VLGGLKHVSALDDLHGHEPSAHEGQRIQQQHDLHGPSEERERGREPGEREGQYGAGQDAGNP
jgi:hypothetical protein